MQNINIQIYSIKHINNMCFFCVFLQTLVDTLLVYSPQLSSAVIKHSQALDILFRCLFNELLTWQVWTVNC